MSSRGLVITVAAVISILAGAAWLVLLGGQNGKLSRAEQEIPRAMQQIEKGQLWTADSLLKLGEWATGAVQGQWAALPGIREREQTLSSHLANLRVAFSRHLRSVDTALAGIAVLLRQGNLGEAEAAITAARTGELSGDSALQALACAIERMRVQDFKGASEAAQQCIAVVDSEVPVDRATRAFLPVILEAVERERAANHLAHKQIATEVRHLIDEGRHWWLRDDKPLLRGKAMIWDATKNEVEMAYQLLPDNLRASSDDGTVTVFSIVKREQVLVGHYMISNQPGYKEKMTIGVVYWPERKCAGKYTVWGGDPAEMRVVQWTPEYGSSVNIKEWVERLPTDAVDVLFEEKNR